MHDGAGGLAQKSKFLVFMVYALPYGLPLGNRTTQVLPVDVHNFCNAFAPPQIKSLDLFQ